MALPGTNRVAPLHYLDAMRIIALFGPAMLFLGMTQAQITFNHRYTFGFPATVLTSIVPTDSCYYATGVFADSAPPYNVGNVFLKIGLEGTVTYQKAIKSTVKSFETWFKTLCAPLNGGFALSGYSYDSTGKSLLLRYNPQGDSIWTREFFNPFYPNQHDIQARGLVPTIDGGFLLANYVRTSDSPNADIQLIRADSLGNIEWDTVYSHQRWDRPEVVLADGEGNFYVGAQRANTNMMLEGYTAQCHILKVGATGNVLWDYLTPPSTGLWDAANDMVLLEDGSLVIATGEGTEVDWPSVNRISYDKCVFKLSPNGEIVWKKVFEADYLSASNFLTNIEKVSNGSGFVVAGTEHEPTDNTFIIWGWVSKVSNDGESLWTRRYAFEELGWEHKIFDLKETSDGGFLLCGESKNWYADSIPQQAWLLKLDQYGCLVPGCHPLPASEPGKPEISLAIYPNPATDYLNFQLRNAGPKTNASFRIASAGGQVMKEFAASHADATFIVPVWEWASGAYFLQYLEGGVIQLTTQFIKN